MRTPTEDHLHEIIKGKDEIIREQDATIQALEERAALAEMIITHGKAIVESVKLGIDGL